jgi:hypothetical protein
MAWYSALWRCYHPTILAPKLESMVDPETIAVCFEQTGVSYRTKEESDPSKR